MWFIDGVEFTDEMIDKHIGFVYIITNLTNGRLYIGKKLLTFAKTKQEKGKKKKIRVASDWQTYYGSNDELKSDVETLGVDSFRRDILHLCKTKGECNYLETREIIDRRALESNNYYNGWLMVRVSKSHIKSMIKD